MINYNEFTKELKSYYYDFLEDAAAAIYEDGVFDKLEALLFIVHYEHDGKINKEEYKELSSKKRNDLEAIIENIRDENDGSDIFGHSEDEDTYSFDD